MNVQISVPLPNFKFTGPSDAEWDCFQIINTPEVLVRKYSQVYINRIGELEKNHLENNTSLYSCNNLTLFPSIHHASKEGSLEHNVIYYVKLMVDSLWFIKDNSVHFDGILFMYNNAAGKISKNVSKGLNTMSDGTMVPVDFSSEEIEKSLEVMKMLSNMFSISEEVEKKLKNKDMQNNHNIGATRINRALTFLNYARHTNLLYQKITFYMSVLECLFSTDTSELTHKICERATLYLSGEKISRLENFKIFKDAYKLRSTYIHGSPAIKGYVNDEQLSVISTKVDSLLRQILLRILKSDSEIFLQENNTLETYFLELILD